MTEPTAVPDAIDHAGASFWTRRDLEDVTAGVEPFREDESFEITDLSDEEWDTFVQAINE